MTASSSPVSLSNRALLSIGARAQISDFNEGSVEANAIRTLFIPTFEALARAARWGCLRKQATLSLLAAAQGTPENQDGTTLPLPPEPWLYQYAYPADCLAMRYIVPSFPNSSSTGTTPLTTATVAAATWLPNGGQIPFAIAYAADPQNNPIETILCNTTQAQAVYTVNQSNPIIWDSLFEAAFVGALAAYLVPALSLDMPLMQISIRTAESAIQQARVADGNEGVTCMDHIPDWITARASGSLYGYGYGGGPFGGFVNMSWPGY